MAMGSCNIFGLFTLKLKGSGIVIFLIGFLGNFAPEIRPDSGNALSFNSCSSPLPSFSLVENPQVAFSFTNFIKSAILLFVLIKPPIISLST